MTTEKEGPGQNLRRILAYSYSSKSLIVLNLNYRHCLRDLFKNHNLSRTEDLKDFSR